VCEPPALAGAVDLSTFALTSSGGLCGRKKLPFAGYSVVKDHPGEISPLGTYGGSGRFPPDPLRSLTRGAPKPRSVRSRICLERRERCRSTNLPILLMPLARRKQDRKNFLSASPPSRYGGQPSISSPGGLPTVARFRSARWQPNGSRAEVGEYRARTGDLLVANQALSQLS
jgi:hypothetical protein